MIFSKSILYIFDCCDHDLIPSFSLLRMRQELSKLVLRHTNSVGDVVAKTTAQSTIYELLLQGLSVSSLFALLIVFLAYP